MQHFRILSCIKGVNTRIQEGNTMKYNKFLISAVSITAAVTLLAGCAANAGGKSGKKDKDDYEPEETTVCADDYYYEETVGYYDDWADSGSDGLSYKSGSTLDAAGEWESDGDYYYDDAYAYDSSTAPNQVLDPETERLLIRTVGMEVKTTTYVVLCNNVNSKINEYGGYIEYLSAYGTGEEDDLRYAYYTIRVPADKLDALIESLDGSCTVVSKSESTSDVTLDYVDTTAYLDAQKIEEEQLMEMLDEATDLDTILILQNELSTVRYNIEWAESSLRVMENQVTFATLNLTINEITVEKAQEEEEDKLKDQEEKKEPTYAEEIEETFNESLENVKDFFKEAFLGLVSISIVLVPVLVIVIIAVIIICVKVRKYKKAKKAAAKKEEKGSD